MIQVFRADHTPLVLNDELGRGGEAAVLAVGAEPGLVAKVYHKASFERVTKLQAMIASPPSDPTAGQNHVSICWPQALIFDRSGTCLGFLMPRVNFTVSEPVFKLYNPKDRWRARPGFTWRYLLRTAVNISSAVEAIHAKGYVVGDLNESNLMVAETALVTLVDCDSMQVPQPGGNGFFRCPVGKPEYTPPELQGRDFSAVDRNATHDNFGLAVLIFHLLMEGIHPFAGVIQGMDMSLEERIRRGESPYAGSRLVKPMPIAPPFEILPREIQALFWRCFHDGHSNPQVRPDAREWRIALALAEQDLAVCQLNAQHVFSGHCAIYQCPWCQRTALFGGIDPFPQPGHQMALPAVPPRLPSSRSAVNPPRPVSRAVVSPSRPLSGSTVPRKSEPIHAPVKRAASPVLAAVALLGLTIAGMGGFFLWTRGGGKGDMAAAQPGGCGIADGNIGEFVHLRAGAFANNMWTYQVDYMMPAACGSGSLIVDGAWVANYQISVENGKLVSTNLRLPAGKHIKVSVFSRVEGEGSVLATKFLDTAAAPGTGGSVAAAPGASAPRVPGCQLTNSNIDSYVRLVEEGFGKDSWSYRAEFSMPPDCQRGSVAVEGNTIASYDKKRDAGKFVTARIHLQPAARFKVDVLSASGAVLATKYFDTKTAPGLAQKQADDTVYSSGGEVLAPHVVSIGAGEYTDQARKARVEGAVAVEVIVGRDGKLRDPSVVHSLGSGLDQKAIEAVMAANIRPGMKGGQPVAVRYRVNVDFKMPVTPATLPASGETGFDVVHEHLLGIIGQGCSGRLTFEGNTMRFESSKHPRKFTKDDIYTLDSPGPGFIDNDRKRWKFHVDTEQKRARQERNAALAKALDEWFHTK